MVQLFIGLMIYAGLMPEDRRKPSTGGTRPPGNRTTTSTGGKKSNASASGASDKPVRETPPETPPPGEDGQGSGFTQTGGNTFVLMLPSGPQMTLTVQMDVMRASVADRNFIFKIVDELREYSAEPNEASGGKKDAAGKGGKEAEDAA